VIEEMLRVTRPGGLILVAERNSRASLLVDTSVHAGASIDDLLERMRFLLICERGKQAIGEGNNSIGDLLPGYFVEQGVHEQVEIAWERRLDENRLAAAALTDGSFHTAGGNILYIIAGQKPGSTGG
jgi:hypothetical protein